MEKFDANEIEKNSTFNVDICIVGAGAAGVSICRELKNLSLSVILLESGDERFNQETQSLYDFTNTGHRLRSQSGYISRNRYLGGSTNTWMGQCAPLDELDFTERAWVKNSGWPITKTDLEPFYIKACEVLKIPKYKNFNSNDWFKYLLDKQNNFFVENVVAPTSFLLGKRPINMRLSYLKELLDSLNIRVISNANVINIATNLKADKVLSVDVKTLRGNVFKVKAKTFVLACGGWENARILLASNRQNPNGLANDHDTLGRYYMEHPKIVSGKVIPYSKIVRSPILIWKKKIDKDGYLRIYLKLSPEIQEKEKLLNHSIEITYPHSLRESLSFSEKFLSNLKISKSKIHELVKFAPHIWRLLENLERLMLNLPVKFDHLLINNHMEQVPNKESHVSLGNEVDKLGMKKLNVNLVISSEEKRAIIRFHEIVNRFFESKNIAKIESEFPNLEEDWPGITDSSHHMGTTRMNEDQKFGYVDKDCKIHGLDNMYVVGSSVFPTGGHVNPTFTIVALALRLADKLRCIYST